MAKAKGKTHTARRGGGSTRTAKREQTGRITAPRQQSARRTEADERLLTLRREIAEKIAEGKRLRRDIEKRIDKALKER